MKKKQFLAILLALCMTLGTLPMTAFAAENMPSDAIAEIAEDETETQEENKPVADETEVQEENEPTEGETDVTDTAEDETDGDTIGTDEMDIAVCTGTEDCTAAEHEAGCPKANDSKKDISVDEQNGEEDTLAPALLFIERAGDIKEISTADELKTAIRAGGNYILTDDIGSTDAPVGPLGTVTQETSIDLNGHTLYTSGGSSGGLVSLEGAIDQRATLTITSPEDKKGEIHCINGDFIGQNSNTSQMDQPIDFELTIENVDFYAGENTTYMLHLRASSDVTLTNCSFNNGKDVQRPDTAVGAVSYWKTAIIENGKAIGIPTDMTTLIVNNCTFKENYAGIRFNHSGRYKVTVTDSKFTDCNFGIIQLESINDTKYPGSDLELTIEGTTFEKNRHSLLLVGNAFFKNGDTQRYRKVNIRNSTFKDNLVTEDIYIDGSGSGIRTAGIYYSNGGLWGGEGDRNFDDVLTIEGCDFLNNRATSNPSALYVRGKNLVTANISNSMFYGNVGNNENGAADGILSLYDVKKATITGTTIKDSRIENAAGDILQGSAIYYNHDNYNNGEIILEDCIIKNNKCTGFKAEHDRDSLSVTMNGVEITGNQNRGIYIGPFASLTVTNSDKTKSTITNNTSSVDEGGGIYFDGDFLNMSDDVIFCNNTTVSSGSDIFFTWYAQSVKLPNAQTMDQIYSANNANRKIDGWYLDYDDDKYIPNPDGVPCNNYSDYTGHYDIALVASYKDTPQEAKYYVEHYQQQPNRTYILYATETLTGTIGSTVTITADTAKTYPNYHVNDTAADAAMSGEIPSTGTLTLKVYYDLDTHNVAFDLNGGKGDDSLITAKHGQAITIPSAKPTKGGYRFQGWKNENTGTIYQPGDEILVTDNMTLVAQWKRSPSQTDEYRLHFESNGGTRYSDEWYEEGTKVSLDKVPKRSGYEFTGWYADEKLEDKIKSITMNTDKTVYAGWKKIKDSEPGGDNGDQQGQTPTDVPQLNKKDHFAYVSGYPEGDFRPERNMTRAEVAVMFSNLLLKDTQESTGYGNTFTDVASSEWYYDRVGFMEQFGIISGYPDGSFRPNAPITRAEFATIAAKFDELKETGNAAFTDLPDDHWGKKFIEMAYNRGWISGYPDGTVKPDKYITRAEVVSVTNRILERVCDQAYIESHKASIKDYFDITNAHWAYYNIMEASNDHLYAKDEQNENWISLNP